jgi:hypothetical protein
MGGLFRKSPFDGLHLILQGRRVTEGRSFDGVYCVRVSPDGKYVIAGNRGYNVFEVMERKTFNRVYRRQLPFEDGMHLGLHHSEMIARG